MDKSEQMKKARAARRPRTDRVTRAQREANDAAAAQTGLQLQLLLGSCKPKDFVEPVRPNWRAIIGKPSDEE